MIIIGYYTKKIVQLFKYGGYSLLLILQPVMIAQAQVNQFWSHRHSEGYRAEELEQFFQPLAQSSSPFTTYEPIYRLGVGDRIQIDILEFPEYGGEYLIGPDGTIDLPWVKAISVLNLSLEQLREKIEDLYTPILKYPLTTVTLTQVRPVAITATGEVNNPGIYPIDLDLGRGAIPRFRYPTIPEVLQAAGGITLAADISQIQVHRLLPNNQKQIIKINVLDWLDNVGSNANVILQDGDKIFVPTQNETDLSEILQLATVSFATPSDQPRNVSILGEVVNPGEYVLIGGDTRAQLRPGGLPTVSWAIRRAGGIKRTADLRRIQIYRQTKRGSPLILNIDLWAFLQGEKIYQNTILQNGDIIRIPSVETVDLEDAIALGQSSLAPSKIRVFIVGEKFSRIGITRELEVPLNTPMNQALLSSDSFIDRRVRQTSVDLVSVNPDGSIIKRQIPVDLGADLNYDTNPPLKNGDIIIVSRSHLAKFLDLVDTVDGVLELTEPIRGIFNTLEALGYIGNPDN